MSLVQKYISIVLSSDPANEALNVSNGNYDAGSRFQVSLNGGIRVPPKAVACDLWVEEATLWWTMLNIITGVNDGFNFRYQSNTYDLIIDQGIYDVQNLYDAINRAFLNDLNFGASGLAGLPFQFIPMIWQSHQGIIHHQL